MRFWTRLQYPFDQAVLVEDGKIITAIPDHPPKTHVRRVACIGEYDGNLVVMRPASYELWTPDGYEMLISVPIPKLYACHGAQQFGRDLLVCSSGLDMFFLMDAEGNIKWEWWGHEHGLGGRNPAYGDGGPEWIQKQISGKSYQVDPKRAAHFNSIWVDGTSFLTAALKRNVVARITPHKDGFDRLSTPREDGIHSPILANGHLVYGTRAGVVVGGEEKLSRLKWVKFIRAYQWGYAMTHETGVTFTDLEWRETETITLARPFQFALLER